MKWGSTNVWHENWTGLGALYHVVTRDYPINEDIQEVDDLRVDDAWDEKLLDQSFPIDIAQHIRQEVLFDISDDGWDFSRWMPTLSGNFSVSSAWKFLRHRAPINPDYSKMWTQCLPFNISLFLLISMEIVEREDSHR